MKVNRGHVQEISQHYVTEIRNCNTIPTLTNYKLVIYCDLKKIFIIFLKSSMLWSACLND